MGIWSESRWIPGGIWLESMWIPPGFHVEFGWNPYGFHLDSIWNLVGLGSAWIQVNLVGIVGIWWEFGGSPGQIWVGSH